MTRTKRIWQCQPQILQKELHYSCRNFVSIYYRGVHRPKANDAFPTIFQISPSFQNISVWEHFSNFFQKMYISSTKLFGDFVVIDSEFKIPPIFAKTLHFPLFLKIYYFTLFLIFFPNFVQFTCFGLLYVFFVSP